MRAPTHVALRTTTCPPYKMPSKGSSGSVHAAPTRPTRASRLLVTSCYPFPVTYSLRGLPLLDGTRMRRLVGSVAFSAGEHLLLHCHGFVLLSPEVAHRCGPTFSEPVTPQSCSWVRGGWCALLPQPGAAIREASRVGSCRCAPGEKPGPFVEGLRPREPGQPYKCAVRVDSESGRTNNESAAS